MNPYVAYVLKIRDEITSQNNNNNNNNIQRIEWTIKTRFSKLHSFHKAIQRDKMLCISNALYSQKLIKYTFYTF